MPTRKKKKAKAKRKVAAPRSKNGRVLTVKHLPERTYQAYHNLPHGTRAKMLAAVLTAGAVFILRYTLHHEDVLRGDTFLSL